MDDEKLIRVRRALFDNTYERGPNAVHWPFLTGVARASKRQANKLMLGAIVDYQVPVNRRGTGPYASPRRP